MLFKFIKPVIWDTYKSFIVSSNPAVDYWLIYVRLLSVYVCSSNPINPTGFNDKIPNFHSNQYLFFFYGRQRKIRLPSKDEKVNEVA